MRNRRFISILLTLCMVLSLLPTSALAAGADQYTDVAKDAWYYNEVSFVTEKGYFKGYPDNTFKPDETMTRAMFVTVLARYDGAKVDDSTSTFTDVPAGEWYTGAVTWAAKKGIVEGRGNGIFDPNGTATREEMCTIIDRYLKVRDLDAKIVKKPATITDMDTVSAWAKEAVEDCVSYGVIIGYPDGTFGPKITAARAHVAAILHRLQIIVDEAEDREPSTPQPKTYEAVYIGVEDFVNLDTDVTPEDDFKHMFFINGKVKTYDIEGGDPYVLENMLRGGYIYNITVKSGKVIDVEEATVETGVAADFDLTGKALYEIESPVQPDGAVVKVVDSIADDATVKVTENAVYKAFVAAPYTAPVAGTPGLKTLKNFLATGLHPVGTALYVYGGAWDWQDDASSNQSMTIGIPQEWIDFFQANDATYHYKQTDENGSHANSYHTSGRGWNQYYWAGVDCSAFVGWTVYNVMNTESGKVGETTGYVGSSTKQAKTFAGYGWGTLDQGVLGADEKYHFDDSVFAPGDVFSMSGHVWVCIGTCEDGSIVFMHSTPNTSNGAGIQISAIGPDKECEAYQLASHYMETYYPMWGERYDALLLSFDGYTVRTNANAGKFTWNLGDGGVLTDPDGYANKTAVEILNDLFGDDFKPTTPEEPTPDDPTPSVPSTPIVPAMPNYTAIAVRDAVALVDGLLHKAVDATNTEMVEACVNYDGANATINVDVAGELNEAHLKKAAYMALEVGTILVNELVKNPDGTKQALLDTAVVEAVEDVLVEINLTDDAEVDSKADVKAIAKEIVAKAKKAGVELRKTLANYNGSYPFESITVQVAGYDLFTVNANTGLDVKGLIGTALDAKDDALNAESKAELKAAVKPALKAAAVAVLNTFDVELPEGETSRRAAVLAFAKTIAKELHETVAANGGPTNEVTLDGSLTLVMDVKDEIAAQCTDTFTVACEATLASDLVTYEYKDGKDYLTVTVTEAMQAAYDKAMDKVFAQVKNIYFNGMPEIAPRTYAMRAVDTESILNNLIDKHLTPDVIQALGNKDKNEDLYDLIDAVIDEATADPEVQDLIAENIDLADFAQQYIEKPEGEKESFAAGYADAVINLATSHVQEALENKGVKIPETIADYAAAVAMDKAANAEVQKLDKNVTVNSFADKAQSSKQEAIESGEMDQFINEEIRENETVKDAVSKLEPLMDLVDLLRFDTMKEKKLSGLLKVLKSNRLDDRFNGGVELVGKVLDELMLFVPADASVTVDGLTVTNEEIVALREADTTKEVRLAVYEIVESLGGLSLSSFEDGADITVTAAGYEYTMNLTIEIK